MNNQNSNTPDQKISRRKVIGGLAGLALAVGAAKVGANKLHEVLGKHFHELTPEEVEALLKKNRR